MTFLHATESSQNRTFYLDGEKELLISDIANTLADLRIEDPTLANMLLKIIYKHGSVYMVGDHTNFIEVYEAPSAYF